MNIDLSNIDDLRHELLDKVVDKELRLKIAHSTSISFLRTEYYRLNNPVIIKTEIL